MVESFWKVLSSIIMSLQCIEKDMYTDTEKALEQLKNCIALGVVVFVARRLSAQQQSRCWTTHEFLLSTTPRWRRAKTREGRRPRFQRQIFTICGESRNGCPIVNNAEECRPIKNRISYGFVGCFSNGAISDHESRL